MERKIYSGKFILFFSCYCLLTTPLFFVEGFLLRRREEVGVPGTGAALKRQGKQIMLNGREITACTFGCWGHIYLSVCSFCEVNSWM